MESKHSFVGKVAIVTGSGKRDGIGFATAKALAEKGASVVLTGRRRDELEELTAELKEQGYSVTCQLADLANEEEIKSIIDCAVNTFGRLDILVNNAAFTDTSKDGGLLETPAETWELAFKFNVMSVVHACKYAIQAMKESGGGNIINIGSGNSTAGSPFVVAYGSTKGAVDTLTKYIATQYADDHIRCNCLALGLIRSGTAEESGGLTGLFEGFTLTNKLATIEDIAEVITFFASDASWYITGEKIAVDGGYFAYQPAVPALKSFFKK